MSFLSDFEGRIGSVFGAAPQGYTEPFSFKKLAKRAAREMEAETYEIDGVDTAPALYTVLVSASDDSLMRPLYEQITYETASFVQAQAQKRGYSFVGSPLVRFMVDPSLRSGKFAVFAENVDAKTLARLREEERAFLGGNSSVGGAAAQLHRGAAAPAPAPAPAPPAAPIPAAAGAYDALGGTGASASAGLDVIPMDFLDSAPAPVASASESTPMPVAMAGAPLVSPDARPAGIPVPQTRRRAIPSVDAAPAPAVAAAAAAGVAGAAAAGTSSAPAGAPEPGATVAASPYMQANAPRPAATCMLIDRQTGQTFTAKAPSAIIGRERSQAQIVLRDPNVSRRHAQLSYDGRDWHISDLRSTNGTLVNDVDVTDCVLRDGDLVTLGLVNLEFRGTLQ